MFWVTTQSYPTTRKATGSLLALSRHCITFVIYIALDKAYTMPPRLHGSCSFLSEDGQYVRDNGTLKQLVDALKESCLTSLVVCEAYATNSMLNNDSTQHELQHIKDKVFGSAAPTAEIISELAVPSLVFSAQLTEERYIY